MAFHYPINSGGGGSGVVFGQPATGFTPGEFQYVDADGNQYGDPLATRDSDTKLTFIVTDIELVEPSIESTVGLFTGIYQDFLIGAGSFVQSNASPETHFAFNIASIREDGLPNGMIGGGVLNSGTSTGVIAAGLYEDTYHTPYFELTAQVIGGGGYRTLIKGDETGLRLRTDDAFLMDSSQGYVRFRTSSSATDYWDLPTVAGAEGYVLTGHGNAAPATWEPGGGSAAGNNMNVQFNDGGLFGGSDLFTWDDTLNSFNAINNFQPFTTPVVFNGSGVDDMTDNGSYSGAYTKPIVVQIDGYQEALEYSNLSGGTFAIAQTITGSVSGAIGTVEADDGAGQMTILVTNGIHFQVGDVLDNGSGVTADLDNIVSSTDTFSYTIAGASQATFVVITGGTQILNDSFEIEFATTSGHTYQDSWSFLGVQYQNTVLANRFNLSTVFGGIDTFATGAGYEDGSQGIVTFSGLLQTPDSTDMPTPGMGMARSTTSEQYVFAYQQDGLNNYLLASSMRNGDGNTSQFVQTANGFQFNSDGTFKVGRNNEEELFRIESNDGVIKAGDILGGGTLMEINLDDQDIKFDTAGSFEVNADSNQYLNITGGNTTIGDVTGGYGNLGVLRFDAGSLKSYWGDEDDSGTGAIIRLDRLNGIIEGITSAQMLFSTPNFGINVDTEQVFNGNNDQVRVGWTNSGVWQLFDKDSNRITIGDVNGDLTPSPGGSIFLDVGDGTALTRIFTTSVDSNRFGGGLSLPSISNDDYGVTTSVAPNIYHYTSGPGGTGATTFNLDQTYPVGQVFVFSDSGFDANANNITIDAQTGNTIVSGVGVAQTYVLSADGQSVTIQKIGTTQWMVIS